MKIRLLRCIASFCFEYGYEYESKTEYKTKYFVSQLVQRGHGQENKVSGRIQRDQFQQGD